MNIATYYQKLLEKARISSDSFEPLSFMGMFDSGTDYLFNLIDVYLQAESAAKKEIIKIDISGLTSDAQVYEQVLYSAQIKQINRPIEYSLPYATEAILNKIKNKKVVFTVYLGQDTHVSRGIFVLLNRFRNLSGWNFSYILFGSPRFLSIYQDDPIASKVIMRNLIPVLPLDKESSITVLSNYECRYQQMCSDSQRETIISLSGGNPGLIKSLYLQNAGENKKSLPDLNEPQLKFRLSQIASDLDFFKDDNLDYRNLFGYVKDTQHKEFFSPLISNYVKMISTQPVDSQSDSFDKEMFLTRSQRKVLAFLKENPNRIINRDELAEVLWGDKWHDNYSDWAIDQMISTLRKKIIEMHIQGAIVTKKGEGIIYTPST